MVRPSAVRVGAKVLVPWGLDGPVRGEIVEIWDGPPIRVRVLVLPDEGDEFDEPFVILLDPAVLEAA